MEEKAVKEMDSRSILKQQPSTIVKSKFELWRLKMSVVFQLFKILRSRSGSFLKAIQVVGQIKDKYEKTFGEPLMTKAAKVDGRYYWRLGTPGFPSKATTIMHQNEVNRFLPVKKYNGLRTVIFAITKQCPLNCEHCFEWQNLHKTDTLSTNDIIQIVHKYQDFGTTQIMFSGGEPMLKVNEIYQVLEAAKEGSDFWIFTSGLGLSLERAKHLKKSGLTGVIVSLDHFDPTIHDTFRGYPGAYKWATEAVVNCNKAGLVTVLSLCVTKSFVNEQHFNDYMELAKKLGVSFVQIVDPRATGRYFGKDVELNESEIAIVEKAYLKFNAEPQFKDYPIINYLGYHQRKVGCFGSGDRFFYIDTDGDAHICPFCSKKLGNALKLSAEETVDLLAKHPCHSFANSEM